MVSCFVLYRVLLFTYCLQIQRHNLAEVDAEGIGKKKICIYRVWYEPLYRGRELFNFLQQFGDHCLEDAKHSPNMVDKNLNNLCIFSLSLSASDWP
jgi:hypothetical protein